MKDAEFIEGVHYYLEKGKIIFTEIHHLGRGYCCGNKCRHCPYEPIHQRNSTTPKELAIKEKHYNFLD